MFGIPLIIIAVFTVIAAGIVWGLVNLLAPTEWLEDDPYDYPEDESPYDGWVDSEGTW